MARRRFPAAFAIGVFVFSFPLASFGSRGQSSAAHDPSTCSPTPRQDLMPTIIAPMAGRAPVWFIDGGGGIWSGADRPVKSVWIVARDAGTPLRATGRRIDGNGTLTFRRGLNGPVSTVLTIEDPQAESMIPGGASPDTMRKFAFVASYIFYSDPGCWEIETHVGRDRRAVVVLVR